MTKELVEFTTEDGAVIVVESTLDDVGAGGYELVSSGPDETPVIKSKQSLAQALGQLKPITEMLFKSLNDINHPSQIELEFGVKLGAKAGLVIASADSEVTFRVKLAWSNKKP